MEPEFPESNIEDAQPADLENVSRQYRGNVRGVLSFDEHVLPLDYIIAADGHLLAPLMVAAIASMNTVLFAPEENDDALQILVTPEELGGIDFESADTDRWRVYHGEPKDVRWGRLWVESLKLGPVVFDGEAVALPNPFADAEAGICKRLNLRPDDLKKLARKLISVDIAEPVMVGADPWGIDVRAHFGVVRLPFRERLCTADQIGPVVERLLAKT